MEKGNLLAELQATLSTTQNIGALVEQFISYGYNVAQHSKWTMRTRETHLRQFARFCEEVGVDDISRVNLVFIDTYFTHYGKTHGKSTTNTSKRILKVFVAWLKEYKELQINLRPESVRSVKVVDKAPKALDKSTIAKVVRESNEQDALLIATAYEAGLRISELVGIKVSDVEGNDISVLGKGSVERTAHITKGLAEVIQTFVERYRNQNDYLFQKDQRWGGGQLTTGTARIRIQNAFRKIADIEMHPHQLRHSFAIHLLESGCDIVTIQHLLGHQDITTTMTYLRVADTYVKKTYQSYIGKSLISHRA